jgi:hypothetical protein
MPFQPGFRGRQPLALSLFGSATATAGLTLPASIIAGDIIFYGNWARNFSGGATSSTPTGYTSLIDADTVLNGTSAKVAVWVKIAAGTEGGGNPGGMNGGVENLRWAFVFRGNRAVASLNVYAINNDNSDGDPPDETVNAVGRAVPSITLAGYRSSANVTTRSFSPAEDTVISPSGLAYVKNKIFNSAGVSVTVGMGDDGNCNSLWSLGVEAFG